MNAIQVDYYVNGSKGVVHKQYRESDAQLIIPHMGDWVSFGGSTYEVMRVFHQIGSLITIINVYLKPSLS